MPKSFEEMRFGVSGGPETHEEEQHTEMSAEPDQRASGLPPLSVSGASGLHGHSDNETYGDDNEAQHVPQEMQEPEQDSSEDELAQYRGQHHPNKVDKRPYDYIDDDGRPVRLTRIPAEFGAGPDFVQETQSLAKMEPFSASEFQTDANENDYEVEPVEPALASHNTDLHSQPRLSGSEGEREDFAFGKPKSLGTRSVKPHSLGRQPSYLREQEQSSSATAKPVRQSRFREHLEDDFEGPGPEIQQHGVSSQHEAEQEGKRRWHRDRVHMPAWFQRIKNFLRGVRI